MMKPDCCEKRLSFKPEDHPEDLSEAQTNVQMFQCTKLEKIFKPLAALFSG